MKKGLSIGLGIGAGVCVLFGVCGCLYGFDARVRSWFNKETGISTTTEDLGAYKDVKLGLDEIKGSEDSDSTGKQVYSDMASPGFIRSIAITGFDTDFTGNKAARLKVLKGDENAFYFVKNSVNEYGGVTVSDQDVITVNHTIMSKESASDKATLRLYMIGKPAVYKDYDFTFTSAFNTKTEEAYKAVSYTLDPGIPVYSAEAAEYKIYQSAASTVAVLDLKVAQKGDPGKSKLALTMDGSFTGSIKIGDTTTTGKSAQFADGSTVSITFPVQADDASVKFGFKLNLVDEPNLTAKNYKVTVCGVSLKPTAGA